VTNKLLPIWNRSGNPWRQVPIAGRNSFKSTGRIDFRGNYAERGEQEWDALRSLMAAGDVVIGLSPYECDVMIEQFGRDKFPCGKNVSFELPPTHKVNWRLVLEDGLFARFTDQTEAGTPQLYCCGQFFEIQQMYARHRGLEHQEGEEQPHAKIKLLKIGHMDPRSIKGSPSIYEPKR
jgi:hypothetical protein